MFTRKVVTVSAAAVAAIALSIPLVQAQDGGVEAGSLEAGSLDAGSLVSGDGPGGSLASASGEGSGENGGSAGSLTSASGEDGGSAGPEDGSLADLVPTTAPAASCELPDLGGSVAKFYPLFGLTDLPSAVMDMITSALSSFPNVLDMVAGDGSALLSQTGSLTDPLCTSIFGGEMQQPPITVVVDGDGNPVTTVTGTVAAGAKAVAKAGTSTSTLSGSNSAADTSGEGFPSQEKASAAALPTTVPVP